MLSWQQLELFVKTAIRMLKGRRRDQAAFFVAALCFSGGFALPKLVDGKWITSLQIALYATGAIALVYGFVRVWRLVNPPELPPAKDRPSAIKGPMAFTEADGDLFRKLGRESELQKLLGLVLDDQVLMVVVRGASGAGKTSLLRAGLKHILGDGAVFHYWEAVPSEPDKGLLRAIQERWPEGAAKPATLAELVNPSDALGRQSHVIVLDQFEQLRGSRKIFQLLRRIIRESRPPHRITWVIAFRREFSADWLDFISPEQENGVRPPQDVSLRLFTAEQAREVIGQLINESDLKDSIEQSVINNLVEAATVDGEVSPVDIGIGLLVLTELHERQSSQTITIRDYQFAGGAEGLLTQYISRCLEPFPKESQEAILKAMLALRDPEENRQRLATGLTIEELAAEAGTDARVLKLQLNRLADRDIRLLETETPTDGSAVRYRLPHERLIPALYRLTGKLLAEVDQAKLKFQNAFQAWKTNDNRSRYLLKGKELRLVQHYETQIPWGHEEQEKKGFLFQSKRRRRFVRAATAAAVLALIGAGWSLILQYDRSEGERYLTENGYPAELYDFQHQLKKLEMTEPLNLERFTGLSSDSIEELSLAAARSSNSIAGLTSLSRCRSLKKLTLYLGDSQVSDLKPLAQLQGVTQLTLNLGRFSGSQVSDLGPLAQLQGLTQLTLNLGYSQVGDLKVLAQLKELTQLTLDLGDSQVSDLTPLAQLQGLTHLTLNLRDSKVGDLKPLSQLKESTRLRLVLSGSQVSYLLEQLNALRELRLDLTNDRVSDLKPLEQLKQLTQLTLDLGGSQVSDLKSLEQLKQLTQLTLYFGDNSVSDLKPLEQLRQLTQLTLNLGSSSVSDLKPLEQLKQLTQLTFYLGGSSVSDLKPLEQLEQLTQLTLYLGGNHVSDLQTLGILRRVTQRMQLTLYLSPSEARNLQPLQQLNELTQLTVDFNPSETRDLQALQQLKELTQLTLYLQNSQVSNLESIRELTSLQTLSIVSATRTQRMSLRNIPATLVELKFSDPFTTF
jgi:internalin A